ncbi:MAG: phosphate/phosphite/phosphonate ABC transporter substrate-binding protein [Nitrospirae bacterium]|nr:phosphate/phosphite/phosphonate ABC transporter substrate-binding protein [Nitrospirota bacterium]MCL5421945.1 phosphate/phosphite/phosphonate ABC transporter substrate-binding protein [Nitrospirota bacterium]
MKKFLIAIFGILTLMAVFGRAEAREDCLIMGLIPAEDPRAMMEQYTPMKNWMEKDMGMCITIFTATDYTGVVEAMRAKKVDFAWFGPFSYVLAHDRAGAEAFAVGMDAKGSTTYRSYLVATPEAAQKLGIANPLEGEAGMNILAGKLNNHKKSFTFAFTETASTSGYAVPRYYMMKAGIDPDKVFKKVGYVGTHDAAELVVKNKIIDMVADNDVTYPKMAESGKISPDTNAVIWKSDPLPGSPLALRSDLPESIKEKLKRSISRVPKDVVTGYGKITGYKIVSDKDYTLIKEVKKAIDSLK